MRAQRRRREEEAAAAAAGRRRPASGNGSRQRQQQASSERQAGKRVEEKKTGARYETGLVTKRRAVSLSHILVRSFIWNPRAIQDPCLSCRRNASLLLLLSPKEDAVEGCEKFQDKRAACATRNRTRGDCPSDASPALSSSPLILSLTNTRYLVHFLPDHKHSRRQR